MKKIPSRVIREKSYGRTLKNMIYNIIKVAKKQDIGKSKLYRILINKQL